MTMLIVCCVLLVLSHVASWLIGFDSGMKTAVKIVTSQLNDLAEYLRHLSKEQLDALMTKGGLR